MKDGTQFSQENLRERNEKSPTSTTFAHEVLMSRNFSIFSVVGTEKNTPYSPDLSLCDISFPRLKKKTLKLRRHENIEAATMELTAIPKEAFTRSFQDLQKRWQQCIDCGGDYSEGDRNH
jgi:hypothetical protein